MTFIEIIDAATKLLQNKGTANGPEICSACPDASAEYVHNCLFLEAIGPNPRIIFNGRGNVRPENRYYKLANG